MTAGPSRRSMAKLRAVQTLVGVVVIAGALGGMLALSRAQAATPTFVQGSAKEITSGTTNSLAFDSANTAGNLIVVYVVWSNRGSVTLSDSGGNTYAAVAPASRWGSGNALRSQVFYAKNVAGDRKSTRLNSSHTVISYAVFCLKKKKKD